MIFIHVNLRKKLFWDILPYYTRRNTAENNKSVYGYVFVFGILRLLLGVFVPRWLTITPGNELNVLWGL